MYLKSENVIIENECAKGKIFRIFGIFHFKMEIKKRNQKYFDLPQKPNIPTHYVYYIYKMELQSVSNGLKCHLQ